MSDSIRLRILTEKSVIWFGQYINLTVRNIIDLRKQSYLRWVYYNYEGISFVESILKEIGIITEKCNYTIIKPGKNIELHKQVTACKILKSYRDCDNNFSPGLQKKVESSLKKRIKAKNTASLAIDKIKYSKKNLAWKNQGH